MNDLERNLHDCIERTQTLIQSETLSSDGLSKSLRTMDELFPLYCAYSQVLRHLSCYHDSCTLPLWRRAIRVRNKNSTVL